MKNKIIFITGILIGIVLLVFLASNVQAASCGIYTQRGHSSTWAKTVTSTHDEGPTFNNYLFAKTLAWSVNSYGGQSYHEGPTAREYNVKSVTSKVNVPEGRGQWYECQTEGHCNRCGIHADFEKFMFAF